MFVDAKLIDGRVYVSHYTEEGERKVSTHLPPYVYYYPDKFGTHQSILKDKLKKKKLTDRKKFYNEVKQLKQGGTELFESDVTPVFRLLEERFPTNDTPPLNIAILDIECDKDPAKGWANVSSPYAIINAITIFNKWENQYYTLSVAPPTMTRDAAIDLLASGDEPDEFGVMDEEHGYFVCQNEAQLLLMTLEIIAEADVLTGWNSTFFDLPYLIQRVRMVLGGESLKKIEKEGTPMANPPKPKFGKFNKGPDLEPFRPAPESVEHLKKFCLAGFDCLPEMAMVERYGNLEKSFNIFGRVHLDYLELYRKFTFEELHSYKLDAILQREVEQSKVEYTGSLDVLYREDFRTFIAYNRQDVAGLEAMDSKLKMIELANTMSHMAGVTFDKVFGSVAIIEQAILRELHRQDMVYFDKKNDEHEHVSVPGAFVVEPHKGLYDWVASYDINSLYPSVIRALNISPECVVGQFKPTATNEKLERLFAQGLDHTEAWAQFTGTLEYHYIMDETDDIVTFVVEGANDDDDEENDEFGASNTEIAATGKQWKEQLKDCNWSLSANGTVCDLKNEGIVPFCLTKWYAQRQEWQAEKKARKEAQKDATGDELARLKEEESYYGMIQLVMKIFLNSTYGALLNRFCRFYDPRLGKSTTLTGRLITKHMIRYSSELMTGNYEFDRNAIIYGDTDSVYCTLDWYMGQQKIEKTVENAVKIGYEIGDKLNTSFPQFMDDNCMTGLKRGAIIETGLEVVGRRGLFKDVKKRYAIHMVHYDGYTPKDGEDMKIMGMEVRRSDTPKFIQDFLTDVIVAVVKDSKTHEDVYAMVTDFREVFYGMDSWRRGTPCRVSKLTVNAKKIHNYETAKAEGDVDTKKPRTHFSVVGARNTNILMDHFKEHRWDIIRDGDKIEVLYLRPNDFEMVSVAIKVGENHVPDWFKALPFDDARHEAKLIDRKLFNVVGNVMDWSFEPVRDFQDVLFEEVDFFAD